MNSQCAFFYKFQVQLLVLLLSGPGYSGSERLKFLCTGQHSFQLFMEVSFILQYCDEIKGVVCIICEENTCSSKRTPKRHRYNFQLYRELL